VSTDYTRAATRPAGRPNNLCRRVVCAPRRMNKTVSTCRTLLRSQSTRESNSRRRLMGLPYADKLAADLNGITVKQGHLPGPTVRGEGTAGQRAGTEVTFDVDLYRFWQATIHLISLLQTDTGYSQHCRTYSNDILLYASDGVKDYTRLASAVQITWQTPDISVLNPMTAAHYQNLHELRGVLSHNVGSRRPQ